MTVQFARGHPLLVGVQPLDRPLTFNDSILLLKPSVLVFYPDQGEKEHVKLNLFVVIDFRSLPIDSLEWYKTGFKVCSCIFYFLRMRIYCIKICLQLFAQTSLIVIEAEFI